MNGNDIYCPMEIEENQTHTDSMHGQGKATLNTQWRATYSYASTKTMRNNGEIGKFD